MPYQKKSIEQFVVEKQKRIDKAIASKEKSIAYMNSVNSAIALIKDNYKNLDEADMKAEIVKWRDYFYQLWQEWYLSAMPVSYEPIPPLQVDSEIAQGEEYKGREKEVQEIKEINNKLSEIQGYGD